MWRLLRGLKLSFHGFIQKIASFVGLFFSTVPFIHILSQLLTVYSKFSSLTKLTFCGKTEGRKKGRILMTSCKQDDKKMLTGGKLDKRRCAIAHWFMFEFAYFCFWNQAYNLKNATLFRRISTPYYPTLFSDHVGSFLNIDKQNWVKQGT